MPIGNRLPLGLVGGLSWLMILLSTFVAKILLAVLLAAAAEPKLGLTPPRGRPDKLSRGARPGVMLRPALIYGDTRGLRLRGGRASDLPRHTAKARKGKGNGSAGSVDGRVSPFSAALRRAKHTVTGATGANEDDLEKGSISTSTTTLQALMSSGSLSVLETGALLPVSLWRGSWC